MSPTISKLLKIRDFGDGLIFPFLNVRGMLGRCQIVQKINDLACRQCSKKIGTTNPGLVVPNSLG